MKELKEYRHGWVFHWIGWAAIIITVCLLGFLFPSIAGFVKSQIKNGSMNLAGVLTHTFRSSVLIPLVILVLSVQYGKYHFWSKWYEVACREPSIQRTGMYVLVDFSEELLFRGTLLWIFLQYGFLWAFVALPIQGILWGASHLATDERPQTNASIVVRLVYYPLEGMLYGLITILTGNIFVGYALHLAGNIATDHGYAFFKAIDRKLNA